MFFFHNLLQTTKSAAYFFHKVTCLFSQGKTVIYKTCECKIHSTKDVLDNVNTAHI